MRKELFYQPGLLLERVAQFIADRRRFNKLKNTVAEGLNESQIDSLELIELVLKNNDIQCIYDLGANVGTWSRLAHALIPHAQIHAFEPIPEYQNQYQRNCNQITTAQLHKVGVGNTNGEQTFNLAGHSSSFFNVTKELTAMFPNEKKVGEIQVNMVRLDDYVQRNAIPLPDLMKLDVEGFELEVLKHAITCMKHCRFIILEVSFIERHLGQPLFHDVIGFMASKGYEVFAFPYKMPLSKKLSSTDILFRNTQK